MATMIDISANTVEVTAEPESKFSRIRKKVLAMFPNTGAHFRTDGTIIIEKDLKQAEIDQLITELNK